MTAAADSPGGVPHPSDDLPEHGEEPTGGDAFPHGGADDQGAGAEASADPVDDGQEDQEDDQERGLPAGQWLMAGLSGLTLAGTLVWQVLGVAGLVAGGLVTAGGVALYRGRKDAGGKGMTWTRTRQTSSRTGGAPPSFGRTGKAGGKLGGLLGGGRSGGRASRLGMPGLGGKGRGGGRAGKGAGFSLGGAGKRSAAGGGRAGRMFGQAKTPGGKTSAGAGRTGGKAGGAGSGKGAGGGKGSAASSRTGGKSGGGAGRRGPAAQAARKAARAAKALDARTGHRASGAAKKAGRWVDSRTGGRAGRAARAARSAWRKADRQVNRHRGAARVGLVAGLLAVGTGVLPAWAAVLGAVGAAAGGLTWWRLRGRRKPTAEKASADENAEDRQEPAEGEGAGQKYVRCPHCHQLIDETYGRRHAEQTEAPYLFCPHCHMAYAYTDPGRAGRKPDEPTRDHTNTSKNRTNRRTAMDSGFPIAVAAAEVHTVAAAYAPADMWGVATDLRQFPDVFASVALAVRAYASRLEGGYAVDPVVVQEIGQIYMALAKLAEQAQSIEPLFRTVHAEDLKRGETPRVGEEGWNV